ncbi:MarR family winged helix-turn-helix transcriptional regulator [Roseivirga sp. E12]|uniref:MarR family winged helix-turn-helix transcriptional regulator n=1 Tax=Roseivirga sp. E12 TaxID=2819237 RepID=UPI001ABC0BBD|nr:MarR family winged helix-turn-helix transcriptional regulator [Roseivirga sp. E12]MBO3698027.1 winged helix-turn-helix transcriptional regulator [Roseivirga sp. E12]
MTLDEQLIKGTFQNEKHQTRVNIIYTGYWLGQRITEQLKPYDISLPQLNVLRILKDQNSAPISTLEIKELMIIGNADASRLVDKLCAKKLIWKKPCPHDGRKIQVFIDDAGLDLLEKLDNEMSVINEITDNLNGKELKVLNQLLNKLRA